MKKSFFILSIFIVIIALFSSCSKSDEANPTPEVLNPNIEPFIKYTYNNVEYQHTPETLNSLKKTILGYSGINDALKKITLIHHINTSSWCS